MIVPCWKCGTRLPVDRVDIRLGSLVVICRKCKSQNVLPRPQVVL